MKKVLSAECNLYYRESFLNILQTYVFQSFFFLQIENVCVRLELVEGGQADAPNKSISLAEQEVLDNARCSRH